METPADQARLDAAAPWRDAAPNRIPRGERCAESRTTPSFGLPTRAITPIRAGPTGNKVCVLSMLRGGRRRFVAATIVVGLSVAAAIPVVGTAGAGDAATPHHGSVHRAR